MKKVPSKQFKYSSLIGQLRCTIVWVNVTSLFWQQLQVCKNSQSGDEEKDPAASQRTRSWLLTTQCIGWLDPGSPQSSRCIILAAEQHRLQAVNTTSHEFQKDQTTKWSRDAWWKQTQVWAGGCAARLVSAGHRRPRRLKLTNYNILSCQLTALSAAQQDSALGANECEVRDQQPGSFVHNTFTWVWSKL